jgi:hypothetical protein
LIFNYDEFVQRNIGFVSLEEQSKIKAAKIFVAGIGGMGATALMTLVRAGVGEVWLADFDTFECSNLNRQIFANTDYLGKEKVAAAVEQLKKINPDLIIRTFDQNWLKDLDEILLAVTLVINGCDDSKASITLMRRAPHFNKTVIDAFAAPLPNVYVIGPTDPRPEEWMKFPSVGKKIEELDEKILRGCFEKELLYVLINSSAQYYVDHQPTRELFEGKRKRFSFAPMVICTGTLMAFEALKIILEKPATQTYQGYFLNPWKMSIERPANVFIRPWRMLRTYLFFKKIFRQI